MKADPHAGETFGLPVHAHMSCPKEDGWPHVHLWGQDEGRVVIEIRRWFDDSHSHRGDDGDYADKYLERSVNPIGPLARLLGDTMDRRVARSIRGLIRAYEAVRRREEEAQTASRIWR